MKDTFLTRIPVAHRGLHNETKPENSIPAFQSAIANGFAIETDVRLSKDGMLVVFHDEDLLRMTGVAVKTEAFTAEELSLLRLGSSRERIPLFSEFLAELDGKAPLLLEIKNVTGADTQHYIRKIADALKDYKGEYAVQSFQPFYVKAYKELCPDILCGVLGTAQSEKADFGGSALWRIKARVIKNMSFNKRIQPDFISYHFSDYPLKAIDKFEGIKLAWTIRSEEDEAQARKFADNIIFENYLPKH